MYLLCAAIAQFNYFQYQNEKREKKRNCENREKKRDIKWDTEQTVRQRTIFTNPFGKNSDAISDSIYCIYIFFCYCGRCRSQYLWLFSLLFVQLLFQCAWACTINANRFLSYTSHKQTLAQNNTHTHTHIPPMLLFLLTYQTVNMAFENSHSIWHAQIAAWCCNNLCNMCVACSFWCCSFVVVTPTHQYTHIVTHSKWWPHTIDFYEKREYRNIAKQENMTRSIMCDVNNRLITRENMFVLLNFVWLVHRYFGHDNFLGFSSFFFCLSWQILASWSNTQLFEQLIPSILTGNDSARILEYSNYVGSLFSCDGFCCCYRWQSNCTSNWNQGKPQDICRINH